MPRRRPHDHPAEEAGRVGGTHEPPGRPLFSRDVFTRVRTAQNRVVHNRRQRSMTRDARPLLHPETCFQTRGCAFPQSGARHRPARLLEFHL